jgi:hypothetical protein
MVGLAMLDRIDLTVTDLRDRLCALAFSAPGPPSTTSWPSPPRNGAGRRRELLEHVGDIEERTAPGAAWNAAAAARK